MPSNVHHAVAPALAGHAFQQAALVGMLPLLAERLRLEEAEIGGAVALGMLAAACALPFLGLWTGRRLLRLAIVGVLGASLALIVLIGAPTAWMLASALPILVGIRIIQGISAGALLVTAQQASLSASSPLGGLAKTQSYGGIGRLLGTLFLGPLLFIAAVVPLVPAALGALVALMRSRGVTVRYRSRERLMAPLPRMLVIPLIVQAATGAAQVGLAPLVADRLAAGAELASAYAGICLAAANLGMLGAHRWVTPRLAPGARPVVQRLCPLAMAGAAGLLPLSYHLAAFSVLSAIVGATAALLLAVNLSDAMTARPEASGQASGWNGAAQIGALAIGVGLGSLVMPLSPAAPFLLAAMLALALAITPHAKMRSLR